MTLTWNVINSKENTYLSFGDKNMAVLELKRLAEDWLSEKPYRDYVEIHVQPNYDVSTGEEVSYVPYMFLRDGIKLRHVPKEMRDNVAKNGTLENLFKVDRRYSSDLREHLAPTLSDLNKFIFEKYGTWYKPSLNQILNVQKVEEGYLLFYWE